MNNFTYANCFGSKKLILKMTVGYVIITGFLSSLVSTGSAEIISELLNASDATLRPYIDGPPVNVTIGFYIVSFGSISEINMDYSMTIYLRMYWHDPRLAYPEVPNKPNVTIAGTAIDKVWKPDLFFSNEKEAYIHQVSVPNRLLKVAPDGSVAYSVRITLSLTCHMELKFFPMDSQKCEMRMESYGYDISELMLFWAPDPVEKAADLELPQFELRSAKPLVEESEQFALGAFSVLKVRFSLRRHFGFYLLQTYIPTILIVALSWISFWISPDAVPARISLGVTTLLTITTELSGTKASIPKVSSMKAIDVWMFTCMAFVFAATVEFAFVNALSRKAQRITTVFDQIKVKPEEKNTKWGKFHTLSAKRMVEKYRIMTTHRRIDKCSRFLFPFIFGVFNVVYWTLCFKYNDPLV